MAEPRKWLIERPQEEYEDFKVFEVVDHEAVLRYTAISKPLAMELISALEWMDSFKSGTIPAPLPIKQRGRPKKVSVKAPVKK